MSKSSRMSQIVAILLVSLGLALAGPIDHRSRDSWKCDSIRAQFQPYLTHQHYHHQQQQAHHRHNSDSRHLTNLCPSSGPSSCCKGLDEAIEAKTRIQFSNALKKHVSGFRKQFDQHSTTVKHRVFTILDDTLQNIKSVGQERLMARTVESAEAIFDQIRGSFLRMEQTRGVYQQLSVTELEDNTSGLMKAVVIDILENDFVSIN